MKIFEHIEDAQEIFTENDLDAIATEFAGKRQRHVVSRQALASDRERLRIHERVLNVLGSKCPW